MPYFQLPSVRVYYERLGSGPHLLLIHGSWGDARDWTRVMEPLSRSYSVVRYDRRGHSRSERTITQGSPQEDADDLAALLQELNISGVNVAANSWGGIVALHCVLKHPDLITNLALHEPPLFDLVRNLSDHRAVYEYSSQRVQDAAHLIDSGNIEAGAQMFVDVAIGEPGTWDSFHPGVKRIFVRNAPTFLDEMMDADALTLTERDLASIRIPVLLTRGTTSPPIYAPIVEVLCAQIPSAHLEPIEGAGHLPQISHPQQYCRILAGFFNSREGRVLND